MDLSTALILSTLMGVGNEPPQGPLVEVPVGIPAVFVLPGNDLRRGASAPPEPEPR